MNACSVRHSGDSPEVRRLCLRKTYYCVLHDILPTDKMAEKKITLAEKWQTKNLHISKKSSTFVA